MDEKCQSGKGAQCFFVLIFLTFGLLRFGGLSEKIITRTMFLLSSLCANFPSLCKKLIDNRFDCSHNSTTRRIKYLHGKALCEHCVFVLYAVGTRYQCSQIQYVQNNVYLIYSAIAFPSQFYQTAFGFAQFTLFSLLFCFRICIARFKYFVYLQCI